MKNKELVERTEESTGNPSDLDTYRLGNYKPHAEINILCKGFTTKARGLINGHAGNRYSGNTEDAGAAMIIVCGAVSVWCES